jgi:hypothetical protein
MLTAGTVPCCTRPPSISLEPSTYAEEKGSVFGQKTSKLHPKRTRQDTKKLFMWGFVGVFSLETLQHPAKTHPNCTQNRAVRLQNTTFTATNQPIFHPNYRPPSVRLCGLPFEVRRPAPNAFRKHSP